MEGIAQILGMVFIVAGALLVFTSAFGIIRMPDFFTRVHPAGMSDSAGIILIMIGLMFHLDFGLIWLKLIILTVLAIISSTTACHALAKSALHSGMKPIGKIEGKKN